MSSLIGFDILALLGLLAQANPSSLPAPKPAYGHALDIEQQVRESDFKCLRDYGFTVAFLRFYTNEDDGSGDKVGIQNIKAARNSGLAFEGYVTPALNNRKSGTKQCHEAITIARENGFLFTRIWVQITSPANWNSDQSLNREFIKDFVVEALVNNVDVGFYTNWYDFEQILGANAELHGPLWYWHMNGHGSNASTFPTFDDYIPFGKFDQPWVKQYSLQVEICGLKINRNIFDTNRMPVKQQQPANLAFKPALAVPHQLPLGAGRAFIGKH